MTDLKSALYSLCETYVEERITAAEQALKDAHKSANDDTKSSAGDKYETGREMMKQEVDRNMAQLTEANKIKIALKLVPTSTGKTIATEGNVVVTDNGNFYIAVSAGKLNFKGEIYYAISPSSPIGLKLKGLKSGELFTLNGKTYTVLSVI